jgi:tetratricopeptide (TPR) repeat protein
MQEAPTPLERAIQAAQAGQFDLARSLFIDLVDQDANNIQAWVYLSWLMNSAEDRLIAVDNALTLQPGDEELLARREEILMAHPHLREESHGTGLQKDLDEAKALVEGQRFAEAVALLRSTVEKYSDSELPWLELAKLEPVLKDRVRALEKALLLNPDSSEAQRIKEQLQKEQKNPFLRGQYLEAQGAFGQAIDEYVLIVTHSRKASERLEAQRRIESIQLRQEAHTIQPVNPDLNLGRLALGPVLLFFLLLFFQSGLKITHLPVLAIPGSLSVIAGSLLVAITDMIPAHPRWVQWFGQPGSGDEPDMRRGLRLLGWALMLAPYTIFFIEAGARLAALQSSILSGTH